MGCLDEKHRAKRQVGYEVVLGAKASQMPVLLQVILLFPLSLFALWTFAGAPVLFEAANLHITGGLVVIGRIGGVALVRFGRRTLKQALKAGKRGLSD